jgi:hypothetical protein
LGDCRKWSVYILTAALSFLDILNQSSVSIRMRVSHSSCLFESWKQLTTDLAGIRAISYTIAVFPCPHSLAAEDIALSRRRRRFNSAWGYHYVLREATDEHVCKTLEKKNWGVVQW